PLPTGYSHAQTGEESDINFWTGDAPSPAWTWVEGSGYQRYDKTISVLPLAIEVASAEEVDEMGFGTSVELVGTQEPFYLNDGTKAYLQAVRETDGTVGFRVFVIDVNDSTMYALTDPLVNFDV